MSLQLMHPGLLWLLLLLLPLIAWYVWSQLHQPGEPSLRVSSTRAFDGLGAGWRVWLKHLMFVVDLCMVACLIIILCRPQKHDSWETSDVEGTDIVVAMDVSTSMLARDFRPNRFDAAKEVATKFVAGRDHDNIGLVIFAGESFTQVPMTMDNATLVNAIQEIKMGVLEDGTAIGDGIATAINRIKDGKARSKSIILLTDGSNNTGVVAPLTAASAEVRHQDLHHRCGYQRHRRVSCSHRLCRQHPVPAHARGYRRVHPSENSHRHRWAVFPCHKHQCAARRVQGNRCSGENPHGRAALHSRRGQLWPVGAGLAGAAGAVVADALHRAAPHAITE